jgi:hypothetical protein
MNDQTKTTGKLAPITVLPDVAKLPVHPHAELYPEADASEFTGLVESIRREGILVPLTLFDDGGIHLLEGRHRRKAGLKAGHRWRLEDFKMFAGTSAEAELYVLSINSLRRHLTDRQKDDLVRLLLIKHPAMSSRKLAALCGVSHTTILKLRKPEELQHDFKTLSEWPEGLMLWGLLAVRERTIIAPLVMFDWEELIQHHATFGSCTDCSRRRRWCNSRWHIEPSFW